MKRRRLPIRSLRRLICGWRWLYGAERAETAAAAEAKLAQDTSEGASDRLKLLAQFCFEMNSSGDYSRAAGVMKQFKELYPRDLAGVLGLARVLRAQGHLPEALQAAQQVFSEDPYNSDAYSEAEIAMTGMDRFQGALQLQEQAQRLGVVPGGIRLAAAYLAGDAAELAQETAAIATPGAGTVRSPMGGWPTMGSIWTTRAGWLAGLRCGTLRRLMRARLRTAGFCGALSAGAGRSGSRADEDVQPGGGLCR